MLQANVSTLNNPELTRYPSGMKGRKKKQRKREGKVVKAYSLVSLFLLLISLFIFDMKQR
jgi:di/tricarboxylate transporter